MQLTILADDDVLFAIGKFDKDRFKGKCPAQILKVLGSVYGARAHLGHLLMDNPQLLEEVFQSIPPQSLKASRRENDNLKASKEQTPQHY